MSARPEVTGRKVGEEAHTLSPEVTGRKIEEAPQSEGVFKIEEFCGRNRISLSQYHKLKRSGLGPIELRVGNIVRITREEELAWQRAYSRPKGKALEERRQAQAKLVARGKNAGRLAMLSPEHIANRRRARRRGA